MEPKAPTQTKAPVESKATTDWNAPPGTKVPSPFAKEAAPARKDGKEIVAAARLREGAAQEWARRIATLEGQRGQLTFSKAAAILLAPLSDDQLLVLVGKERALKDMPYSSALALGVTPKGGLAGSRSWGERTQYLATEAALDRCSRQSVAPCNVVMVNDAFRESDFLAWARGASGRSIIQLRVEMLRLHAERR